MCVCVSVSSFLYVCFYMFLFSFVFGLTSLKSGDGLVHHILTVLRYGRYVHYVVLTAAQSGDLAAGILAGARQLRAVVTYRRGPVGVCPEHGRPVHVGRASGAGVVHRY